MKSGLISCLVAFLAGCSWQSDPARESGTPPFYRVHPNGTGPLTMAELQISIPAELDQLYTDEMRACLLQRVEELIVEAGDPERLDPRDVAFLPTDGTWEKLSRSYRRTLLAQAVISRAATQC